MGDESMQLPIISQWHGEQTSPPHAFQVPGLPTLHFILFGSRPGSVVLQAYEVPSFPSWNMWIDQLSIMCH